MELQNTLSPNSLLQGQLYNYRIIKVLGQGSFGITYLAQMTPHSMQISSESNMVAIKEFFIAGVNSRNGAQVNIERNSELYYSYRDDFLREAMYISRMKHPNIIKVIETFSVNNTVYYSMEYIDGENLDSYIQRHGALSEQEALNGAYQLALALSYMHEYGVLHLDVKPLNVMRCKNGDLVLIDFGLAKPIGSKGETESSVSICRGTVGYAPMEQLSYKRGDGFLPTLDVYALGATLFKMLTGENPLDASVIFNEGFPYSTMRAKNINDKIITLTADAMAPLHNRRIQSVKVLVNAIPKLYSLASSARPKSVLQMTPPLQPTKVNAETIVNAENVEICSGFHVRWASSLSDSYKEEIRKLLQAMKKIGEKALTVCGEYGEETINYYPLMSLGERSRGRLSWMLADLKQESVTLPMAIKTIQQLELWTGLPFRLVAPGEVRIFDTGYMNCAWLCYSPIDGLRFVDCIGDFNVPVNMSNMWNTKFYFYFQLVCDGLKPLYNKNMFLLPCTQNSFDELSPIGFSLYKFRIGRLWNITSPRNPMSSYLPDSYDEISNIGVWHIPGPGPERWYIGVYARKGGTTTYYEFARDSFMEIMSLTEAEMSKRAMWT